MTYNDPQEVHGGECCICGEWFADNEADLNADNVCDDCDTAADDESDPLTLVAPPARTDWLALAADIVVQVRL
jgi:hypothetical protein